MAAPFDVDTGTADVSGMHGHEAGRRESAVLLWGAIGAAVLGVIATGMARWLSSDEVKPTPVGADRYDSLGILRVVEVLSAALLIALLVGCVLLPLVRRRGFGFDGMLLIGGLLVHFIDPLFNYFSPHFLQNSYSVQWGSWANFIPGYASPSGDAGYVEGLLWAAALYGVFGICAALGGCWLLRKFRSWRPGWPNVAHYGLLFAIFAVLDLIIENFFVQNEIYVFWGSYSDLTLWPGTVSQFPLYETALATVYALGFVWLRDSRNARGLSHVERGADELRRLRRARTPLRFCAVTGFCLVWGMISYFMPFGWLSMKADSFPPLPSYLEGGAFCGTEGSPDACPSQYLQGLMRERRSGGHSKEPPPGPARTPPEGMGNSAPGLTVPTS